MLHRRATVAVVVCVALAGGGVPRAHACTESAQLTARALPETGERKKRPQRAHETERGETRRTAGKWWKWDRSDANRERHEEAESVRQPRVSAAAAAEQRTWLRVREVAAELDVSIWSVRNWIRDDKLKASGGTPGMFLIHRDDLEEFIRNHRPHDSR